MLVLGIEVGDELLDAWRGWLMPEIQPFVVSSGLAARKRLTVDSDRLSPELRDAFELYELRRDEVVAWLSRPEARKLPSEVRAAQPAPHRWPTSNTARDQHRVVRYVESGRRPSRHGELTEDDWQAISGVLPGARDLAGRFPAGSGPNCFGTVMTAAGVTSAAGDWVQTDVFETWLAETTEPGGRDDEPATVLLWRDGDGQPVHAAVTLGDGWLLHKPSQGWMSPIKVLSVSEGKFSARTPGWRLTRHRIC